MSESVSLSVIVPNFNREAYLTDCLESILAQTYTDLEIVVSDDASTDGSRSVIESFRRLHSAKIRLIAGTVNRGPAAARHEAILQARGEYFTTLDSDDYFCDPRKLSLEMEIVRKHLRETGRDALAFSNTVLVNCDKSPIRVWGTLDNIREGDLFAAFLSRSCWIPTSFTAKRKHYFESGGYNLSLPIYEDWDLKLRLARKYPFYFSLVNGNAYRRHGKGLSAAAVPDHLHWLQTVFDMNFSALEKDLRPGVAAEFNQFLERLKTRPPVKYKADGHDTANSSTI